MLCINLNHVRARLELVSSIRFMFAGAYSDELNQSTHPLSGQSNVPPEVTLDPWPHIERPLNTLIRLSLRWPHMPTCTYCCVPARYSCFILDVDRE